jgi:tetratricopeptide (TPR) repeat protein
MMTKSTLSFAAVVGTILWFTLWTSASCLSEPLPSKKMRIMLDAEYFRDASQDNTSERALEAFIKLVLERGALSEVFTDDEALAASCVPAVSKCEPDAIVTVAVLERNDEARIFARLQLSSGQDQRRVKDPDGITVPMSKLPSGLATLVEQITSSISPPLTVPAIVDISCLSGSTQAEKDLGRALQRALAGWLKRSDALTPTQQADEQGTCAKPSLESRPSPKTETTDDLTHAWLRTEVAVSGDQYRVQVSVWRTASENPVTLPPITIRAPDLADGPDATIVRKVGGTLRGLLSQNWSTVQDAINSPPPERLECARMALETDPVDYDTAFACFELALWDDDNFEPAALDYANSLAMRSRYEPALEVLRIAQYKNVSVAIDLALAKILLRSGDTVGALREYERSRAKSPSSEESFLGIIQAHFMADDLPAARKAAADAIKAFPDSAEPILMAAQIEEAQRNYGEAKALYREGLSLRDNEKIKASLSALNVRLAGEIRDDGAAKWRKQIALLDEALSEEPNLVAHYRRAYAFTELAALERGEQAMYRRTLDFQEAAQGYRNAARLSPGGSRDVLGSYPWLMPNLIEAEIMAGEFDRAKQTANDFFRITAKGSEAQTATGIQSLRSITALLAALAEILSGGSAEKEIYLADVMLIDVPFSRLNWKFDAMKVFLHDFGELHPDRASTQRTALALIQKAEQQH